MREAAPARTALTHAFKHGAWRTDRREVIDETAVAIVVNGGAEAVMMATHADLEDFALGFALTEAVVHRPEQIRELDIVPHDLGVEVRIWLTEEASATHQVRRRRLAGPVGCGLCGVESLEDAMRPLAEVGRSGSVSAAELIQAMQSLASRQPLNAATRAAHAAALFVPAQGVAHVREDIGRHNALDKLIGAMVRSQAATEGGVVLMTSRVSVELVQKAAFIGAPILAAISAPSALAIDAAKRAGITLCGVVRDDGLEVFTHPARVT